VYEAGLFLHGTKADLTVGELLVPGRESNFEAGRVMNYVYFTATLDAATWGAELAAGEGRGRIYIVEPTGEFSQRHEQEIPRESDAILPNTRAAARRRRARPPGRSFHRETAGHEGRTRSVEAAGRSADRGLSGREEASLPPLRLRWVLSTPVGVQENPGPPIAGPVTGESSLVRMSEWTPVRRVAV